MLSSRWPRSPTHGKCSRRFCGSSRNYGRSHHPRQHEAFDCHAFKRNRQEECVQMPVKIARSTPRPSFGLPELLVASHISRLAFRDAAKSLLSTLVSESSGECREILSRQPASEDRPAHLSNHHQGALVCEQAHQQMKEELGLDHFEGRSWRGLHRHALMTMIAYAFLQHRRLATARREKKNQRAAASANFARRTPRHPPTLRSSSAASMPTLSKTDSQRAAA